MRQLTTALLLFFCVSSYAQENVHIKNGDFHYGHNFYKEAIDEYLLAIKNTLPANDMSHVYSQLARTYHHLFDYANAETYYKRSIEFMQDSKVTRSNPLDYLNYAHILRNNEKYEEAKDAYFEYAETTGKTSVADYYEIASDWAIDNKNKVGPYLVFETNLETGGRSFGAAIYKDGLIYSRSQTPDFSTHTTFYDISYAKQLNDSTFDKSVSFKGDLNRSFYEGAPSLTGDEKFMYYTGNASERLEFKERLRKKKGYQISSKGVNILKIFQVEHVGDLWINRRTLSFNGNEYSCTHPTVTPDGKTMFFVSNMPGGQGGYDVYMSTKADTTWSAPVNMGPSVNSSSDEMTPFVQGNKLYFSSKGNMGFGGADIFIAIINGSSVESVRNIGKPFNTSKDDFAFIKSRDGKTDYLSSNRAGTHGYDHIYTFRKMIFPDSISGKAINKISGQLLKDLKITVNPTEGATLEMLPTGAFNLTLTKGKRYAVKIAPEGFDAVVIKVPAADRANILEEFGKLELQPEAKKDVVITFDKIYFDYNKGTLRTESEESLKKILNYLTSNPTITVELSAHTDAQGSDKYNLTLSQERAESTVKWMVAKGIPTERMTAKGYGETKLLNECANGVECTDDQHQVNRRVELKVL